MGLIGSVLLHLNGQYPLLNHVDILEVEIDAQQAHILTTLDGHSRRIISKGAHVLIIEVGDVRAVGGTAETLVVQYVERIAVAHYHLEVTAIGGRTGHDDRQVIGRFSFLAIHERAVVIVTRIGHIDCRHAIIVERCLKADILFVLLVLPLIVTAGEEGNGEEQQTHSPAPPYERGEYIVIYVTAFHFH